MFRIIVLIAIFISSPAFAQKTKALKKASWDRAGAFTISDDRGGVFEYYIDFYKAMAKTGMNVVVDGACFSGCTFVFVFIPRERICVTKNAAFAFHAAIDRPRGQPKHHGVINETATQWMYDNYPKDILAHIEKNGGLDRDWIELDGRELERYVQVCR